MFLNSKPLLFVSAQSPTLWLSCIQLFSITAFFTSQNFPPPVQPQSGECASQLYVSLPAISLFFSTRPTGPLGEYALKPYCWLSAMQSCESVLWLPSMTPAPALSLIVE